MKRVFDFLFSLLALVFLFPFLLLVVIIILCSGSPVFFVQRRPGLYGKPFKIIKFCTMTNDRDQNGDILQFSDCITPFGKFLRSTSIDELPELWNVLKGEMSLVGPRPLMTEYLPLYNASQARRHEVRPGITGWAQINGRNKITWEEKFEFDLWYVDHKSLFLDFKIILITFFKVFLRKDINNSDDINMPMFNGS
jgi:sugar transferase EpsL